MLISQLEQILEASKDYQSSTDHGTQIGLPEGVPLIMEPRTQIVPFTMQLRTVPISKGCALLLTYLKSPKTIYTTEEIY